jgi:hypothetical protein
MKTELKKTLWLGLPLAGLIMTMGACAHYGHPYYHRDSRYGGSYGQTDYYKDFPYDADDRDFRGRQHHDRHSHDRHSHDRHSHDQRSYGHRD